MGIALDDEARDAIIATLEHLFDIDVLEKDVVYGQMQYHLSREGRREFLQALRAKRKPVHERDDLER